MYNNKNLICLILFIISLNSNIKAEVEVDSFKIESYLHTNNIKAEKTYEGIYYTLHTEGTGAQLRNGDYVKVKYTGKLMDGKIFDQSPADEPYIFQLGFGQVIKGWDVLMPKLKVGTKTTLYVPAELGYGTAGIGNIIPSNMPLIFDVEIVSVLSAKEFNTYMRDLEDRERKQFYQQIEERFLEDKKRINAYALEHKLKVNRTESGISYIITKEGKGENAKEGKTITINYEGYLLNDKMFDSNKNKLPFTFKLGEGKVIPGWEEGLTYFSKGSEGIIMIPSKLAYDGVTAVDSKLEVPSHSVLIFKVQVVDIQ